MQIRSQLDQQKAARHPNTPHHSTANFNVIMLKCEVLPNLIWNNEIFKTRQKFKEKIKLSLWEE